jgi:hypothetical protein
MLRDEELMSKMPGAM